jgi:hypothetical protein
MYVLHYVIDFFNISVKITNRTSKENFEQILVKVHVRNLHIIDYTEYKHKDAKNYSTSCDYFDHISTDLIQVN